MKMRILTTIGLSALLLFSCQKEDDLDRLGDLDFSKPAAVGGSLMAGYQDGALYAKGQEKSLPMLFFDQTEEYGGGALTVPSINEMNGIGINPKPWTSVFQSKSLLGMRTDCEGVESLGPVKTLYSSTGLPDLDNSSSNVNGQYQCVPFATLDRMLDPNFGLSYANGNALPYYHRMASNPGTSTMIGELVDYAPSFLLGWFGMEEVISFAQTGGTSGTLMDPVDFKNRLDSVLTILSNNGTKGVLLNVPDVTALPYFKLVQYNGANLDSSQAADLNSLYTASGANHINFQIGPNPFVCEDADAPQGIRHLQNGEFIMLTAPLDSMKCQLYGLFGRYFKDRYYLSLEEVSQLNATIAAYNMAIEELAQQHDFAFCDTRTFFDKVSDGVMWDGADYNFEFVSGGFIGLDGIYPNQKGGVLLTNEIINAVNNQYGTYIPNVNCLDCDGSLFPAN